MLFRFTVRSVVARTFQNPFLECGFVIIVSQNFRSRGGVVTVCEVVKRNINNGELVAFIRNWEDDDEVRRIMLKHGWGWRDAFINRFLIESERN